MQRKQEQLQKTIVKQQEELRKISEQLLMARCGILPSFMDVIKLILNYVKKEKNVFKKNAIFRFLYKYHLLHQLDNQFNLRRLQVK